MVRGLDGAELLLLGQLPVLRREFGQGVSYRVILGQKEATDRPSRDGQIIRVGGSLLIVEAMRGGKSPQEACELAVGKVNAVAVRRGVHPARVAFVALDPRGRVGAACTERTNFQYAVARPGSMELLKAKEIGVEGE